MKPTSLPEEITNAVQAAAQVRHGLGEALPFWVEVAEDPGARYRIDDLYTRNDDDLYTRNDGDCLVFGCKATRFVDMIVLEVEVGEGTTEG